MFKMNLNWSGRMIKYALFIFNLLFVITGIIVIAVGVSVKTYYTGYDALLDDKYFSLPNLLIATGSLIFIISFFGCCGAIKESYWMTFTFSTLLVLIFLLEFSAGIAGYVLRNDTADYLENKLSKAMVKYGTAEETTDMWDLIQRSFQCCGIHRPKDWYSAPIVNETNYLPISCCIAKPGIIGNMTCSMDNNATANYYTVGCETSFGNFLREHAVTIGGVGITIAFIQLFGIIFAYHLAKKIRYSYIST